MSPFLFSDPIFGVWSWVDAIIRILIVVLTMTLVVIYLTYGERKVVARFQQRLGPTKTGPGGLLQGFADTIKLASKEDIRPTNADRWVFEFAPYLTFIPVLMVLASLPFAEDWGVRDLSLGMFYVFAILGLNIVGILMAGLGSGNKYALLGGVRAAAQMISYEIPLVLSLLSVAMIAGTLNLNGIASMQSFTPENGQYAPFIFLQPLAFQQLGGRLAGFLPSGCPLGQRILVLGKPRPIRRLNGLHETIVHQLDPGAAEHDQQRDEGVGGKEVRRPVRPACDRQPAEHCGAIDSPDYREQRQGEQRGQPARGRFRPVLVGVEVHRVTRVQRATGTA